MKNTIFVVFIIGLSFLVEKTDACTATAPTNGAVDTTTPADGADATYTCDTGYTIVGSSTTTCTTGTLGTEPTCAGNACTATAPTNGAVDTTTPAHGAVATYTCDATYTISGSTTATCTAGTLGTEPTCSLSAANNAPVFSPATYSFTATDGAAAGTDVGSVTITDADTDTWTFSITSGTATLTDGATSTAIVDNTAASAEAITSVAATTDIAPLVWALTSVTPTNALFALVLSTGAIVVSSNGTNVGTVTATDADSDSITYVLTRTNFAHFAVDGSGVITVNTGVTIAIADSPYTLQAEAHDTRVTATASVTITVSAANNDPVFLPATYTLEVTYRTAAGTEVGTVTITDADSDTWAFTIFSGNTNTEFAITNTGNLKVGTIATANALDKDTTASYDLVVRISDGTATADATVTITFPSAASNNAPVFLPTTYTIEVTDGTAAGTEVGTVTITDADSDTWAFTIFSGNTHTDFAITNTGNLKDGTITIANVLDKATTASYDLVVRINDGTATEDASVTITFPSSGASALVSMLLMVMCWLFNYV